MSLLTAISHIIPVNSQLREAINHAFKQKEYQKLDILKNYGEVANTLYFIEKGLCRIYYVNESGKDITYGFYKEGDFISIAESFFTQSPSVYCVESLEDCLVAAISFRDFVNLNNEFPAIEKVKSHVLQYFLLIATSRIVALQFQSAQQRYDALLEQQPEILQRAPLGHIASYLGITQETLSRIRAKK
ncbi:putative transcriptional regulator, Crp/Fnr family [Pseudopedobacter saltans DSM 12145]|uniref:Transcriptional regulator, Crp/Fnr family n=1 Tax=Pseudopedobacter saltans (strain ATCC 51119 / DSM 12145 / JCM 21818 / CCUG 39354 / LMG 10337 / NBRC 100064 / NCIMB 13643) TaxID=762903 RepID=F0SED0_PSESL|nr:Crp/Fnr family transcriptional regulator [Pseudopedobacter saltans]ADY50795.1 putative transcriptional regulator, Crp/Fnr family [Pseudopedobacter saltans DSM 12145]